MPAPEHRRRGGALLTAVGSALGGAAFGLAGFALLHAAHLRVPAWYCVAVGIGALGVLAATRAVLAELEAPLPQPHGPVPAGDPPPAAVAPLERLLAAASRERRLYLHGLQPLLRDLARERLRLRHDAPGTDEPAWRVMGDELWQWLTTSDPSGPAPTPQVLQRLVSAIERL